jgi:ribokinase
MSQRRIFVLGSANMDLVFAVPRLPRAGETLAGGDMAVFPGGKGANQAYAAAKLGGRVSMIAAVGSDSFGPRLVSSLADADVDVSLIETSDAPTGCACIYVLPNGENSIVISPGANARLSPEQATSKLQGLTSGDYLLAQLETPIETVEAAFAHAKRIGATTMLDPTPAMRMPAALLENVDILTPNQIEAEMRIGSFREAEDAATRLLALGPRAVMLKLGATGCFYASGSERISADALAATPIDTTAAGDVFNGALAVALAEGKSIRGAMLFANRAAAISVTRRGAQSSAPTRDEVDLMEESIQCQR